MSRANAFGRLGDRRAVLAGGLFTGLVVLVGVALLTYDHVVEGLHRTEVGEQARSAVDGLADGIQRSIERAGSNIVVLTRSASVIEVACGASHRPRAAQARLLAELEEHPRLSQARVLDPSGQERVRVERREDGVRTIDPAHLQDKASRYYFKHARALGSGEIYISALDLNIEDGVIQEPWQPTLRLASPIMRADGLLYGVIVLNIDATPWLEAFGPDDSGDGGSALLNESGYWLAGAPRDKLWGFMFGRSTTLVSERPELWRRIEAGARGLLETEAEIAAFKTLEPSDSMHSVAGTYRPIHGGGSWKILVRRDIGQSRWTSERLAWCGVLALMLGIVSWAWGGAISAKRLAVLITNDTRDKLRSAERMASLGRMVAGIAHELNTPIGNALVVASTLTEKVEMFEQRVEQGALRRSDLVRFTGELNDGTAIMTRGLERAAALISRFKQVSADQTSDCRRAFELDECVTQVVETIRPRVERSGVSLSLDLSARVRMDGYPGPLGQVLLNLVDNALRHGFREGRRGHIEVATRVARAGFASVFVRDDGAGIPGAAVTHVFEPFFSTRLGDGGTGLGLSIVHSLVTERLGGNIEVTSEPGRTEFRLLLPIAAPQPMGKESPDEPNR